MKIFMQEYGRAVLTAIVGSISIGICYFYLTGQFFRVEENQAEQIHLSAGAEPVLIAPDVIKISIGDVKYDAKSYASERTSETYREIYENYLKQVTAYEDSSAAQSCSLVTVAGIEQIDVTTPGRYQVIYRLENEMGRSFSKAILVIVR